MTRSSCRWLFLDRVPGFPRSRYARHNRSAERRRIIDIAATAHVPLAKMSRRIAGCFQHAGYDRDRRGEEIGLFTVAIRPAGIKKSREIQAGGNLPEMKAAREGEQMGALS